VNEAVLYALAEVAAAMAAFSGLVVAFRVRGARRWSPTELRFLWLLVADSFILMLLALLPVPLAMAGWSDDLVWGICSTLLGAWFFIAIVIALRGERADLRAGHLVRVPFVTPILYLTTVVGAALGLALILGAWDLIEPGGEALYVFSLIILLAFAALEFLFFVGLMAQQAVADPDRDRSRDATPVTPAGGSDPGPEATADPDLPQGPARPAR
jgi:hypothetical protein